ncbi:MAG: HigA family addiction module antidote protein [Bacteroidales bacterium]|nr:HigA family addiction module antidote protein [Bacteroidales bacterium]
MNKRELTPFEATHPGELIKDELTARGITQKQLAQDSGISPSVLSETINGKRDVTLNMAIALEKTLDIPAEIWMNLQTKYVIDSAKIAKKRNTKETISVTLPRKDINLLQDLANKFGWACAM